MKSKHGQKFIHCVKFTSTLVPTEKFKLSPAGRSSTATVLDINRLKQMNRHVLSVARHVLFIRSG